MGTDNGGYKKHVSYFYEPTASSHFLSTKHPMVPERINMTHELVQNYGLFPYMEIVGFQPATMETLKAIHLEDYMDFLNRITPRQVTTSMVPGQPRSRFSSTPDCPIFEGVYDYTSNIVGGSLGCSQKLNQGESDICINWSGGMHHARRGQASGFCYTNDIVACIIDLLRYHRRVMYIDIDVHHGDGVEEMFLDTNRVMTVSFHQYSENFFPHTGSCEERGVGEGRNFAINVPLKPGIRDEPYLRLFKKVISSAMERFQPEALVMQMGADSVAGDKLGRFNLSNTAHAACLEFGLNFHLPTIVLGGGGYSYYNVARTWTLETGTILGKHLDNIIPTTSYTGLPGDANRNLRITPRKAVRDRNTNSYLQSILRSTLETISQSELAPSVPLQTVPPDWYPDSTSSLLDAEMNHADLRYPNYLTDKLTTNTTIHLPLEYDDEEQNNPSLSPPSHPLLLSSSSLDPSCVSQPVIPSSSPPPPPASFQLPSYQHNPHPTSLPASSQPPPPLSPTTTNLETSLLSPKS